MACWMQTVIRASQTQVKAVTMSHSPIPNAPRGSAFDTSEAFVPRHLGPGEQDQQTMLNAIGASSLEALMQEVVPANIRMSKPLDLPGPRDEADVLNEMREMVELIRKAGGSATVFKAMNI